MYNIKQCVNDQIARNNSDAMHECIDIFALLILKFKVLKVFYSEAVFTNNTDVIHFVTKLIAPKVPFLLS